MSKELKILRAIPLLAIVILICGWSIYEYLSSEKVKKERISAYLKQGDNKYFLGDLKGATEEYYKAIKLDADIKHLYKRMGHEKYTFKNYEGAIQDLTISIKCINTQDEFAYFYRGYSQYKLGNLKEACLDFKYSAMYGNEEAEEIIKKYCK